MTIGYAAFSTNLNIIVKGNIVTTPDRCFTISDNGDGTGTITEYDINCGSKVKIPETINGITITKIGDASWENSTYVGSFANKNITNLSLPKTITRIGTAAFFTNKLQKVNIPNNVDVIGPQAFRNNLISYLSLPDNLRTIGQWAFHGNSLTEINIPKSVTSLGDGAFTKNLVSGEQVFIYGRNSDGSINYTRLISYAGRVATGTKIPETVTHVGTSAYEGVEYKDLIISDNITHIYPHAFQGSNISGTINISSNIVLISSTNPPFAANPNLKTINIDRKENAISGAPWGATNAIINWTGTN